MNKKFFKTIDKDATDEEIKKILNDRLEGITKKKLSFNFASGPITGAAAALSGATAAALTQGKGPKYVAPAVVASMITGGLLTNYGVTKTFRNEAKRELSSPYKQQALEMQIKRIRREI
jgi:hypothetical protein